MHPDDQMRPAGEYMDDILTTWSDRGIRPKFHISEQRQDAQIGAHSDFIENIPDYLLDLKNVKDLDLMIEAKMKEQAIFRLREKYVTKLPCKIQFKFFKKM